LVLTSISFENICIKIALSTYISLALIKALKTITTYLPFRDKTSIDSRWKLKYDELST
jgi:hypothetical protein